MERPQPSQLATVKVGSTDSSCCAGEDWLGAGLAEENSERLEGGGAERPLSARRSRRDRLWFRGGYNDDPDVRAVVLAFPVVALLAAAAG